eukprot:3728714-Prymnesium_polylepis.1
MSFRCESPNAGEPVRRRRPPRIRTNTPVAVEAATETTRWITEPGAPAPPQARRAGDGPWSRAHRRATPSMDGYGTC